MKINGVFIAALLSVSALGAPQSQQVASLKQAHQAFLAAQTLESQLDSKPEAERSRADYLKVIRAYQRVYLITPKTSDADDALIAVARLYEQTKDIPDALKTLKFLIHDYPGTPFKEMAERDLARLSAIQLQGVTSIQIQRTVSVDNVRYWEAQNSIQIVVDVSGEIKFKQGDAKDPERVFVDLSPAKLNSALKQKDWSINSNFVRAIRLAQYNDSTVRLVVQTGTQTRTTTFALRDPDRVVIDVVGNEPVPAVEGPALPPPATTIAARPAPTPVATLPAPVKKPAEVDAKGVTPAKPTDSGNRSLVRSLGLKLSRVVIDAGHGGHDTGTIGQNGYAEKELVLDVAQRLKQMIETELGAEVVMTREDDNFVPLETRTAIANREEADLFLSIHANSSSVRSVRGVETYFLNFTSSRDALETASRENAASQRSIHELQDLVKKIMLRDKVDESRELAKHIGRALAARKGSGMDRGVKQAPFVVLIGANMPSVLAEICFISNPQDEKLVKTTETRQAIAESLFEGVRSYADTLSGTKTAKQEKTQE